VLIEGTPYAATYYTSNSGEWILQGFYGNPYGIPVGGLLPYVGSTAPNSSLILPYGQAISRTTYSVLFGIVSTTFGSGDGSTTFNVPDIRGRSIFGLDNMGGSAAGRVTSGSSSIDGTTIGASGGAQIVALDITEIPSHDHFGTTGNESSHTHHFGYNTAGAQSGSGVTPVTFIAGSGDNSVTTGAGSSHNHSISAQGGGDAHQNMPPAIVLPYILRVI
jgi:microcystin-dependent protein